VTVVVGGAGERIRIFRLESICRSFFRATDSSGIFAWALLVIGGGGEMRIFPLQEAWLEESRVDVKVMMVRGR
jgi:hypothetical protein